MNVLGIMSGTSLGSVDYALCEIVNGRVKVKELWDVNYPDDLQEKLHGAARGDLDSWTFCQVHHDLGRFYAKHAMRGKISPDLVGLHGQTVFHNPEKRNPATFQLGEPIYLVEAFRSPVVNNFRVADMAAGGQGAPLATMFHQYVFGERGRHVCVNNLGGISNVTSINWKGKGKEPKILAFDTGPANMLMDFAVRHFSQGKTEFDKNGSWAAKGKVSVSLVREWLGHPYFRQKPPKSTGRELFGEPFFKRAMQQMKKLSACDAVATLTEFTASSLALNYRLHLGGTPDKVILTGGGASNPVLVQSIRTQLQIDDLLTSDKMGWPVQAIEPAAFALLAWLRFKGKPGNISQTTGAKRGVLCGQISAFS